MLILDTKTSTVSLHEFLQANNCKAGDEMCCDGKIVSLTQNDIDNAKKFSGTLFTANSMQNTLEQAYNDGLW